MSAEAHEIRFEPSGRTLRVATGTTLLAAAREAELPVASACGADAICARCGLEILRGGAEIAPESDHERRIKQRNRIDPKLRLSCLIEVSRDLVVTAPYW